MTNYDIPLLYWLLFFFIISWIISYTSLPVIINISNEKDLMAKISDRSSHIKKTPTLGGVGIFMGFILSFTIFGTLFKNVQTYELIGATFVLFFLGLKDDILVLPAKTKLKVQIAISLLSVLSSNLTINSFYGFLGIYELNSFTAIGITTFVFVLLINAYNLIDGIDGLASIVAICFLFASCLIFYNANMINMCIISIIALGPIVAFLQFNFSKKQKIFMGDTGSMIVGFLMSYLLINLLNIKGLNYGNQHYQINPVLFISLLFYPLLDTTRVFLIRIFIYRKNPFSADQNHIHHRLIKLGFKHWQTSIFVGISTILLTIISILINRININLQVPIILVAGIFIFSTPILIHKMKGYHFNFFKNGALGFTLLLSVLFFQSCTTKKDLLYFQQTSENEINDEKISNQFIEINDILSIKINSLDVESSRLYNIDQLDNVNQAINAEILKLKGYLVNEEGTITIPVIGAIKVTDKTIDELELFLTNKLKDESHLKEPIVNIRILNAKITVLGEVRSPGTYSFEEKNITLLQAIGKAGDLTINGERKDVLLIRQENNVKTINHIDLTTTDWMSTDLFYIKQNDVIVVNPNNAKIKSAGIIGNASVLISVVSLLLTGILLIKN
jgi:UDP-N-acetylmuramyl pentapeptide phosphotransferase/UDP-N-acetylglucosamine-1-phosphate transferase/protein involved in polysaccharide export with SLBB domain